MLQFSKIRHVNEAVELILWGMDPSPYDWNGPRVKHSDVSIADVVEKIRRKFGERAANSVRITVN